MGCCDGWNPIVRLMRAAEDGLVCRDESMISAN